MKKWHAEEWKGNDWHVVEKLYVVRIYTTPGPRIHETTWTSRDRARRVKRVLMKSPCVERVEVVEQETRQRRAQ
jgi:hypothetical protein